MKKNLISSIIIAAAFIFAPALHAQTDAKATLDKVAGKFSKAGGIEASFQATAFTGKKDNGTTTGTLQVKGTQFKLASEGMTTWFDGKTQWTMIEGSGEVNVSTPTEAERQRQNPYTFLNLYKSGYKLSQHEITYNEVKCREIRMTAQSNKADIQEMRIVLDNADNPVSVRMRRGKNQWIRIRVSNLQTGKNFSDKTFKFSKEDHPSIEVIDLR